MLADLLLQNTVEIWQRRIAWGAGAVVVIGMFLTIAGVKYQGIDSEQRRQLYQIRPQLMEATPHAIDVYREDDLGGVEDEIREAVDAEEAANIEPRVRDAVRTVLATVRATWRGWLPDIPALAFRGVMEGVTIVVFGIILSASAAWYQWLTVPDVSTAPGEEALRFAINAFPATEAVAGMSLATIILFYRTVADYWLPIGILLIAGGALLAWINEETPNDLSVTLYPDRAQLARRIGLYFIAVYLAGAIPTLIGRYAEYAQKGRLAGMALAGLLAVAFVGRGARDMVARSWDRHPATTFADQFQEAIGNAHGLVRAMRPGLAFEVMESSYWTRDMDYWDVQIDRRKIRLTQVYILIRKVFGALALATVPVTIWLAARGIARLAGAAGSRLLVTVGIALLLTLLLLIAISKIAGDEWGNLKRNLAHWIRSRGVRLWIFRRGAPISAMALTFLFIWSLGIRVPVGNVPILSTVLGLWPPAIAAIGIGLLIRVITYGVQLAKYRFVDFEEETYGTGIVVCDVWPPILDADGEPLYVIRIDGHQLVHRDLERLIDDAETVLDAKFEGESVPTTFSRYYWEDVEFGTVDIDQVARELKGDVLSRMVATVRDNNGIKASRLDDRLHEEYPSDAVKRAKATLIGRADIVEEDGRYVAHKR